MFIGLPREMKNRKTALLVAGMHRSGTSALTRVVNLLGADIASDLLSKTEDNPSGYWESNRLYRYHEELLNQWGLSWDNPCIKPNHWFLTETYSEAKEWIISYLKEEFEPSVQFVIKDPRLARILPLWIDSLEQNNIDLKIIIPFREPIEVVSSLSKREERNGIQFKTDESLFYILWLRHMLEVEFDSRGESRSFVDFFNLRQNWRNSVDKLEKDLEVELFHRTTKSEVEIDSFLKKDLQSGKLEPKLEVNRDFLEIIDRVYAAFQQLENKADDTTAQNELDKVRSLLAQSDVIYDKAFRHTYTKVGFIQQSRDLLEGDNLRLVKEIELETENNTNLKQNLTDLEIKLNKSMFREAELNQNLDGVLSCYEELKYKHTEFKVKSQIELKQKMNKLNLLTTGLARSQKKELDAVCKLKHVEVELSKVQLTIEKNEYDLLDNTRYFNKSWYLKTYEDVKSDPIKHYTDIGFRKGYNPSLWFYTNYYLNMNPDVKTAGINPLVHFLKYGSSEDRKPSPNFKRFEKVIINFKEFVIDFRGWMRNGR